MASYAFLTHKIREDLLDLALLYCLAINSASIDAVSIRMNLNLLGDEPFGGHGDWLEVRLPRREICLSIFHYLTAVFKAVKFLPTFSRDDGGIVDESKETAAVTGKLGLFLGPLDGRSQV